MKESNFAFLYEPGKESEVVLLFGALMQLCGDLLMERLGLHGKFLIDEWTESPTDCVVDIDGRKLRVEFELCSSNFRGKHDPKKCDIIVCWKDDWPTRPPRIKVLELSTIVSELVKKEMPKLILSDSPKRERKSWNFNEFMKRLEQNLPFEDFQKFKKFLHELQIMKGIDIQVGRGKDPTITIGFGEKSNNERPLGIYANGKAWISYKNVNVEPHKPILSEEKAESIRTILGGESKEWHEIKASNTTELLNKLRKVIKIIVET